MFLGYFYSVKFLLTLFVSILTLGCAEQKYYDDSDLCWHYPETLEWDFDSVKNNQFLNKEGVAIKKAKFQSNQFSFSGNYSFELSPQVKFGPTYTVDLEPGDVIEASIRIKKGSNGKLVFSHKDHFFITSSKGDNLTANWEELKLKRTIHSKSLTNKVKIYCLNQGTTNAYFDDLKINIFRRNQKIAHPALSNSIELIIPDSIFRDLRLQGFKDGILSDSLKKWVIGKIIYKGEISKCKVKLKGDWTEHIESDKWGMRINSPNESFPYSKFSLIKPNSRSFLREYFIHKVFEQEGLLTTAYDFIGVYINQESKGVFAIEEHFTKQLLINAQRPIGPIIRIDETKLWEHRKKQFYNQIFEGERSADFSSNSEIKNYLKTNKTDENKAIHLLDDFRNLKVPADSVFDAEYLSKFLALIEIFRAHHAIVWHNMRFYYNPTTGKLYPILYDAYSHDNHLVDNSLFKEKNNNLSAFTQLLINNNNVYLCFKKELSTYTNSNTINNHLVNLNNLLNEKRKLLQLEYCDYHENFKFLHDYQIMIKKNITD